MTRNAQNEPTPNPPTKRPRRGTPRTNINAVRAIAEDLAPPLPPGVDAEQLGYAQLDDAYLASEEYGANKRAAEIEREEQREKVLTLRRSGASERAIAAQIGVSRWKVRALLDEALRDLCPPEEREATRQIELDRLDRALLAIWGRVADGDLDAIRVFDRLVNTRIRLCGLDQIDVNVRMDPLALTSRGQVERAILEKVHRMRERNNQWSSGPARPRVQHR